MFTPKEAITIFCYLAMVDGDFSKDEREKISEIGQAVDQWSFMIYKDEIFSGCEKQTKKVIDEEDYYDVISEGVDKIINNAVTATDGERSISTRLLIWNLLVISYADNEFSSLERRLIKHIVRITNTETSVFLEMEQLINTNRIIENEIAGLSESNLPYAEVNSRIEELKKRSAQIIEISTNLIADEGLMKSIEAIEYKPDFIDRIRDSFQNNKNAASSASESVPCQTGNESHASSSQSNHQKPLDNILTATKDAGNKVGGFLSDTVSKIKVGNPFKR